MVRSAAAWLTARIDVRSDRGATAIEYGIMASAIAAMVILAVAFIGDATNGNFVCTGQSWQTRTNAC